MEFDNIKEGDKVFYWSGFNREFPATRTVVKVTKLHFILDNDFKFRKDGSHVTTERFSRCHVTKFDLVKAEEYTIKKANKSRIQEIINEIGEKGFAFKGRLESLSIEKWQKIYRAICE